MPTPIEKELGLGPVFYRFRCWLRRIFGGVGKNLLPEDRRSLDPLTVNYAAWEEMRHCVREWPNYKEAPNYVEVLVSPEDWDDYWGVDSERKQLGVSAYVKLQATKRNLWISGDPQIRVIPEDAIDVGDLEVHCLFVEPVEEEGFVSAETTAELAGSDAWNVVRTSADKIGPDVTTADGTYAPRHDGEADVTGVLSSSDRDAAATADAPAIPSFLAPDTNVTVRFAVDEGTSDVGDDAHAQDAPMRGSHFRPAGAGGEGRSGASSSGANVPMTPPTMRFVDEKSAGVAYLVGEGAFRLAVQSGDIIGAVRAGETVPPEVNVRLDAEGFPYVEVMHCKISVVDGRWSITNFASRGTMVVTGDGARYMLGEPEPFPLEEGDVVWLGPRRPLRFDLG